MRSVSLWLKIESAQSLFIGPVKNVLKVWQETGCGNVDPEVWRHQLPRAQKKSLGSVCLPRLIRVDPIGIEPTTSTLPESLRDSAKPCMSVFIVPNVTGTSSHCKLIDGIGSKLGSSTQNTFSA